MANIEPIGIVRLEALHYYVRYLERARRFYCGQLDFAEVARSSPELEARGRQRSAVFDQNILLSTEGQRTQQPERDRNCKRPFDGARRYFAGCGILPARPNFSFRFFQKG